MLHALLLIPALKTVFSSSIEFYPDSFEVIDQEIGESKSATGKPVEKTYRFIHVQEIKATGQRREHLIRKLSRVTESEKSQLLNAVRFIHMSSKELDEQNPNFAERLAALRQRFPESIIGR
jgi:hypothetical protein